MNHPAVPQLELVTKGLYPVSNSSIDKVKQILQKVKESGALKCVLKRRSRFNF